jgi:hypothetical protein
MSRGLSGNPEGWEKPHSNVSPMVAIAPLLVNKNQIWGKGNVGVHEIL